MIFIKFILLIIYSITSNNLNKLLLISISALSSKIIFDSRNFNTQIKDIILNIKLNYKLIINNKFKNTRILILVYENKIILIGQIQNLTIINEINNILKDNLKEKIKIFSELRFRNKINIKQIIKDNINKLKLNLILLNYNLLKTKNIKIIIENSEIFIIGCCKKQNTIEILNLIKYYFNNNKIILAIIYIK